MDIEKYEKQKAKKVREIKPNSISDNTKRKIYKEFEFISIIFLGCVLVEFIFTSSSDGGGGILWLETLIWFLVCYLPYFVLKFFIFLFTGFKHSGSNSLKFISIVILVLMLLMVSYGSYQSSRFDALF